MKTITKVVIMFVIVSFVMVLLYNIASEIKAQNDFEKRNELCISITSELKQSATENSTCVDYFCYYARYAPPPGYENLTETLCVCDCRTVNGTISSAQILSSSKLFSSSSTVSK